MSFRRLPLRTTLRPRSVLAALGLASCAALHGACNDGRRTSGDGGDATLGAVPGDVAGGQSGGQTSGQGSAPRPCACVRDDADFVRARITRLEGGCVELEVIEPLGATTSLAPGDVIGGVAQPLCWNDPPLASDAEVLAAFSAGAQATSECVEYRACSRERCGDIEDAYTRTVDPDCVARQNAGEPVDCPTAETVDEAALSAWDACDGACATETREACAAREQEAQLGGMVHMGPLTGDQLTFYWAGETRSESLAELSAPDCQSRHAELFETFFERRLRERAESGTTSSPTAPPPEQPSTPVCPLP